MTEETPTLKTDEERRREILEQVAAGEMSPAEAAERLAALDALAAHEQGGRPSHDDFADLLRGGPGEGPSFGPPGERSPGGVRRVKVASAFRSVRIVGDASVREAVADGDHTARIEGDALVIDGDAIDAIPAAFAFSHGERMSHRVRISSRKVRPLLVRMSPDLALDVDVSAGSVTVDGVRGPITATCAAGSLRIDGFAAPLDVTVSAGSVSARGRIDAGESRIQCDAGKVALTLDRSSSVAIGTRVNLGKVLFGFDNARPTSERSGNPSQYVMGTGAGRLDISCNLGAVQVDVG